MKTNVQTTRRGFTLVELLVVIVIIASLAGLTAPMVIRQRKKADQTEAISNAKQIGLAMFEFETEYGSFPDASTAATVTTNTGTTYVMNPANSNGIFLQLFGAGYTQSEAMFYAKTATTRKPDGNTVGVAALAAGEVGFGYITLGTAGLSTSGNPARPYVVTPLLGTSGTSFDPNPFDNKAVVLRVDNSASSLQILPAGGVNLSPGQPLLTANATSVWGTGGGAPTLVFPLPKL
jgi:prepilin-type N-terminal cleavage/methylation domain-containing protein